MVVSRKMTAPDKNKGHVQNHTTWSTAIRQFVAQRGPTRTGTWRIHSVAGHQLRKFSTHADRRQDR